MVHYFGFIEYKFLYSGHTIFIALLTVVKQSVPPTLILSHILGKDIQLHFKNSYRCCKAISILHLINYTC